MKSKTIMGVSSADSIEITLDRTVIGNGGVNQVCDNISKAVKKHGIEIVVGGKPRKIVACAIHDHGPTADSDRYATIQLQLK